MDAILKMETSVDTDQLYFCAVFENAPEKYK